MNTLKRFTALLFAVVLACALALPAFAHDVPDQSRTGTIHFTMTCDGKPVGGGVLTLYHVGNIAEHDGNYGFALAPEYAGSNLSLENLNDPELAQTLAGYTTGKEIQAAKTLQIGPDGTATAENLALGLYLVVQYEPAAGYDAIAPFLVSVPVFDEGAGKYVYEVDATPKMALSKTGLGLLLPQTGQLNWPVPVLTVLGLALFMAGWYLRFGKQRKPGYGA